MSSSTIAVITDFGHKDPFAGIVAGVILGLNPAARIVDVCHEIRPGDIRSAAFALHMAYDYFPPETIFLVVVDPGVGTGRKAVAVRAGGRTVICPDNGIVSFLLADHTADVVVEVTEERFFLPNVSSTFHGRDIFAPVAAHVSLGTELTELGPPMSEPFTFPMPETRRIGDSLQGEIVYIDRFGNLITTIDRAVYEEWRGETPHSDVRVNFGSLEIDGISGTYADSPHGHPAAVFAGTETLEIAINGENAAESLNADIGMHVRLYKSCI